MPRFLAATAENLWSRGHPSKHPPANFYVNLYVPQTAVRLQRLVLGLLLLAACFPAAQQLQELFSILYSRVNYPYDVHWMDGGTLLHAHRLLHGKPIYPPVTSDAGFLPNVYPPFLYGLLALTGKVFGLDYPVGRLISIGATVIGATLLAREVYRQFRGFVLPIAPALLTLGAIAAGFPVTGGWYDATMPDPLALALSIVSACAIAESPQNLGRRRAAFVASAMVLTVYTKQSYIILVAWQILFLVRANVRQGLMVGAATAGLAAALLGVLQLVTHGRFFYYVGYQVLHQSLDPGRLQRGMSILWHFAPYLPFVILASLLLWFRRALSHASLLWSGNLVVALPMALGHFAKIGGWNNNFMPVVFLGPAAAFCVFSDVCRLLRSWGRTAAMLAGMVGAGVYLRARSYSPEPFTAHESQQLAAAALNDFISILGPDLLIPSRPFLAIRHKSRVEQMHIMGLFDASAAGRTNLEFDEFIRRTHPHYVILTDQEPALFVEALAHDYVLDGLVPRRAWPAQTLEAVEMNRNPRVAAYPGQLKWVLERPGRDAPNTHCVFDFESSSYEGWALTGDAFLDGPPLIESQRGSRGFAIESTVVGVVGDRYASSYPEEAAEAATGSLESEPFVVDRNGLELRLGGGATGLTRVELRVGGTLVNQATGTGNNFMKKVLFNVSAYVGRTAQIVLIDDDPYGHVLADHICLVDAPAGKTDG